MVVSVHAELSVLPIGTDSPSLSKYIAKGIKALNKVEGIKYNVTPMGTQLESDSLDKIFDATKVVTQELFEMGIQRVETILKIDERHDKVSSLEDKLDSLRKH